MTGAPWWDATLLTHRTDAQLMMTVFSYRFRRGFLSQVSHPFALFARVSDVPLVCFSGVSLWCVPRPSDVSRWCVHLVCPSSVSLWCVPLVHLEFVTHLVFIRLAEGALELHPEQLRFDQEVQTLHQDSLHGSPCHIVTIPHCKQQSKRYTTEHILQGNAPGD